jgi:hypothetical protein
MAQFQTMSERVSYTVRDRMTFIFLRVLLRAAVDVNALLAVLLLPHEGFRANPFSGILLSNRPFS